MRKLSIMPRKIQRAFSAAKPITGWVDDYSSQYYIIALTFLTLTGFYTSLLDPLQTINCASSYSQITSFPQPSPRISESKLYEFFESVGYLNPSMKGDFFILNITYELNCPMYQQYKLLDIVIKHKQIRLLANKNQMFFCGFCSTKEEQQQSQIEIRNPADMNKIFRVSTQDPQLIRSTLRQFGNYHFVIPSRFEPELKRCREKSIQFEDDQFPANNKSLNFEQSKRKITWKRVTEAVKNAVMIRRDIQPADIIQGNAGDCYFLASLSSIAEKPQRIKRIFCNEMELRKQGIYRFQIVEGGVYKQIIIDDRIPVYSDTNSPVFCKPSGNQVWVMLIQKVWAKLSGSYGNISAGYPHQVLNTFMVSPCFYFDIPLEFINDHQQKQNIWERIKQGSKENLPMCAGSRQAHTCKGIKPGHTYSLLDSYQIKTVQNQTVRLVKLRNPWGNTQYNGRFSQNDTQFWSKVNAQTRQQIFNKKINENDGLFTVQFNQFIRNYECLDICYDISDYNYVFKKAHCKSKKPIFFTIDIEQTQGQEFFITVQKKFDRNSYIKTNKIDYGYSRVVLARKNFNEQQNDHPSYTFIDSILQKNFPDLTLKRKLEQGVYVLMVETEFLEEQQSYITLSLYSKSVMDIQESGSIQNFLERVFTHHAQTKAKKQEKIFLQSANDWAIFKSFLKQGGYGYFYLHLTEKFDKKLQLRVDRKKVIDCGLEILKKQSLTEEIFQQGQKYIVVFSLDFEQKSDKYIFPPRGFRLNQII